jgi:threonine dehydrogenase-like Zn-dependent dehydrogenase
MKDCDQNGRGDRAEGLFWPASLAQPAILQNGANTGAALRGPEMYETFRDKKEGCIKVMMKP